MISRKTWQPDTVLVLGSAIFSSLALGMVLIGLLTQFVKGLPEDDLQMAHFIIGVLSFQGAVLPLVAIFLRWNQMTWTEAFGWRNSSWTRLVAWSLVTGLVVLIVGWELGWLAAEILTRLGFHPEAQQAIQVLQKAMPVERRIIYGIAALGVAPVAEEILFRGLIYPTLKQFGRPKLALWGTSLMFAGIHLNLMALLPLTFVAVMLTWLYEETDNLLAPIIAHCIFNTANFLLVMNNDWLDLFQR